MASVVHRGFVRRGDAGPGQFAERLESRRRRTGERVGALVFVVRAPVEVAACLLAAFVEESQLDELHGGLRRREVQRQHVVRNAVFG